MKITEALVAEHTIFLRVFDEIEKAITDFSTVAEARTMASVIEGMLQSHADVEANLAYLALDHVLFEKGRLDILHADHEEIGDTLAQVKKASNLPDATRLLKSALAHSRRHFRLEEQTIFPLLEKTLHPDTLNELGRSWQRHGEAAPSCAKA